MMKLGLILFGGAFAALVAFAGCTGGPNEGSSSGTSGQPDPPNGDGGDVSTDASGPSCTLGTIEGERVCVPGAAKANTQLVLQAEGEGGCLGCGTSITACKVDVADKTITLTIEAQTCALAGPCPEICRTSKIGCVVPPLGAGTYRVDFAGDGGPKGRELVVEDAASATSCTLLDEPIEDVRASDYASTCTDGNDDTCTLVSEGDPCQACPACPTSAIATTAAAELGRDYRERRASCSGDVAGPACAQCPMTHRAACNGGTCAAELL